MLEDIGGFDPLMTASQDYDVWVRLARKYKVAYINEPLGIYHWHDGDQITKDPKKKLAAMKRIDEKNIDYINKNRRIKWYRMIYSIPVYAKDMQMRKALLIWSKAVALHPLGIYMNIKFLLRAVKGYCSTIVRRKREK